MASSKKDGAESGRGRRRKAHKKRDARGATGAARGDDERDVAERERGEAAALVEGAAEPVQSANEEASAPAEEPEEKQPRWWEDVRDLYLSFDRRTLGFARLILGFFLIFDLWRRTDDWWKMYSDEGVLPTHYNLWRPQAGGWTLFNAFSTRWELWALWAVGMAIFVCLFIGYKTRVAQVLAAIYVASMNGRILLIENGGYVVHNLLVLWCAFLPMGDRFSVDALLKSWKNQPEHGEADLNDRQSSIARWRLKPFVSFVSFVILAQLSAIYFFNVVHKTGPAWHDGTAVHYVLYVDRMANPAIAHLRTHIPWFVLIMMTRTTMAFEAAMTLALFSPLARPWAKRTAIVFINLLHLGFATTFVLGPFAWALCVWSTLLFGKEDWEVAYRTMRRTSRARTVRYDPRSKLAFFWCRLLKRLDRFELLTYLADERAKGLEVTAPDGTSATGRAATGDILCALPLGPLLGAPMRLPLIGHLLGGAAALVNGVVGHAVGSAERAAAVGEPVGYRPEIKDDEGHPAIDSYFMRDWLSEYFGGKIKRLGWYFGVAVLGLVTANWVAPLLKKKLNIDTQAPLIGEGPEAFSRENAFFWGGTAVLVVCLLLFLRPFVLMNLKTPSPVRRKWLRVMSGVREGIVFMFFLSAINQALVELWKTRSWGVPQPEVTRVLSHKLRYLQGWFMFSPNPVMDDGVLVVDAITVDGRRVDPFRADTYDYVLAPPDFDLLHAKSYSYNQIWSDFFNRMHLPANTAYRKPMNEYMFRLPERTGNPNDAIVKGAVYWVHDMNPRWRHRDSYGYGRDELWKFTNPDPEVGKRFQELTGGVDPPEIPLPVPIEDKKETDKQSRTEG